MAKMKSWQRLSVMPPEGDAQDECGTHTDILLQDGKPYSIMVPDSGASLHVENASGVSGFLDRRPTNMELRTGMAESGTCLFVGTHQCFVLGPAPDYTVHKIVRRNVYMQPNFRVCLFSTGAAHEDDGL